MSRPLKQMPYQPLADLVLDFRDIPDSLRLPPRTRSRYRHHPHAVPHLEDAAYARGLRLAGRPMHRRAHGDRPPRRASTCASRWTATSSTRCRPRTAACCCAAATDKARHRRQAEVRDCACVCCPRGGTLKAERRPHRDRRRGRGAAAGHRCDQLPPLRRCRRRSRSDHAPAAGRRAAARLRCAARCACRRAPAPVPPRRHRPRPQRGRKAADRRARRTLRRRQRPRARRALPPVRPLPADQQFAARHPAGQPAGHLERPDGSAVGQQVHHQHQHRDELLAGRGQRICTNASSRW